HAVSAQVGRRLGEHAAAFEDHLGTIAGRVGPEIHRKRRAGGIGANAALRESADGGDEVAEIAARVFAMFISLAADTEHGPPRHRPSTAAKSLRFSPATEGGRSVVQLRMRRVGRCPYTHDLREEIPKSASSAGSVPRFRVLRGDWPVADGPSRLAFLRATRA